MGRERRSGGVKEEARYRVMSQTSEDKVAEIVSQAWWLVRPVITERVGVEHIHICVYEEEDAAVNAVVLFECDQRVKMLVVFVVGAVCWGVHNTLEVVAFCLGNVGSIS